jgi:asparagine synthase (glutamine-hydrolysing)
MIINQDSLHLKFDIEVKTSEKNDETTINGNKYKYIFKQSDQNFSKLNKKNLIKKIVLEDNFRNNLEKLDLNFYLIIWSKNFLFCTVDHISSFQLLYKITDKKIVIKDNLSELNFVSNQFARKTIINSGYTLGAQTLSNSYKTLMPCEYIIYNNNKIEIDFYYNINFSYSKNLASESQFEKVIEKLFIRLKKNYGENNIIVPISSGLDSRFILSALKYFGFKNVKLFTHYFQNIRDKRIAKMLSQYFDYPIEFVNLKIKDSRNIYKSREFNEYKNYRQTQNVLNNHGDFISIFKLIKKKFININTDLIMNGQSGDFISGNHIPLFLFEDKDKPLNDLISKTLDFIILKHFNLWSEKKINKDQLEIKQHIKKLYFKKIENWQDIISSYEKFEFENRQVKWVIGQQKVYDFFGLNSYLPLWSLSMIDFFTKKIHIEQKKNQIFYKEFLIKKNYSNVWKSIPINPKENFTLTFSIIRLIFKGFFLFLGKEKWHNFEKKYLSYFMDSTCITTCYPYIHYIKAKKIPRNAIAFIARDFLKNK